VIEDVRGAWTGADIDAVLESAPSSVLAARDARVKAEALDAEVEALRGYTLDHRSAEVIFDHLIRLIERDAAMLREQANR
jgi:hypothetical protein